MFVPPAPCWPAHCSRRGRQVLAWVLRMLSIRIIQLLGGWCVDRVAPLHTLGSRAHAECASPGSGLQPLIRLWCDQVADIVAARGALGKNYGVVLIPEGLLEHVPEVTPCLAPTRMHQSACYCHRLFSKPLPIPSRVLQPATQC